MRQFLSVSEILPVSIDRVWEALSSGERVERWFPFVARTEVHRATEGGQRTIHLPDGARFEEYITINDAMLRLYQYYAPAPPLPFRHVIGTNRLQIVNGGTRVAWTVSYEPLDLADEHFTRALPGRYAEALRLMALAV